jgi:hypothetical protein
VIVTRHQVLAALARHIGKENGVHVHELVYEVTGEIGRNPARERLVREIVSALREEGSHICAHPSKGYFMAANDAELDRYYIAFLRARALHSLTLISRAKKIALPELLGQLRLNT